MSEIDPLNSTSAKIGRRGFVGLAAAAAASSASVTMSKAQTSEFGKPHPPIVAENDPEITVERPQLVGPGGTLDAYASYPRANDKKTPGVVVIQHIWGVDAQIRDTVRRFAKAGFVAIAPDLYSGMNAPSGDGATDYAPFSALVAKLDRNLLDADARAASAWIRQRVGSGPLDRPPKIGIIGFCYGGRLALRAAIDDANAFDAAVIFYGGVRWDDSNNQGPISDAALAWTNDVRLPMMGQYGERDTSILPDDVRAMETRLKGPHDIKIYPEAGHAFFDDTRARYVASAATDAWSRSLSWFSRYLKT